MLEKRLEQLPEFTKAQTGCSVRGAQAIPVSLDDKSIFKDRGGQARNESAKSLAGHIRVTMDVQIDFKVVGTCVEGVLWSRQDRLIIVVLHMYHKLMSEHISCTEKATNPQHPECLNELGSMVGHRV